LLDCGGNLLAGDSAETFADWFSVLQVIFRLDMAASPI